MKRVNLYPERRGNGDGPLVERRALPLDLFQRVATALRRASEDLTALIADARAEGADVEPR